MKKEQLKSFLRQIGDDLTSRKGIAYMVVAAVICIMVLLLYATCTGKRHRSTVCQTTSEVLDSLSSVLPKGSVVVARFPDELRHCMYYLNSGVLYYFDGKFKILDEVRVGDYPSGSIAHADLSADEKSIMLTMHSEEGNRLFRLNTENRNVVDLNQTVAEKKKENTDEAKDEKKTVKAKENSPSTPEETTPSEGTETEREQVFRDVMEEPQPESSDQ